MRKLTILLMLLVAVSFAGNTSSAISPEDNTETTSTGYVAPLGSKAILFDQAYDGGGNNANNYGSQYRQGDDFSLTNPSRLESVEWWSLFMSSVDTMDLRIFDDSSGLPGTILWEVPNVTATVTDTGDDFSGYDIYHVEVVLDPADYAFLEDGVTYWFSPFHDGSSAYWMRWSSDTSAFSNNNGSSWDTKDGNHMFRFNGTEDLAAPEVSGQVPADGASGVAVNSDIVFHVTDDCYGVDTSTISFAVEDSAKSGEATISLSSRGSTGAITGTLVVDDTDPCDVICTFTQDSDLPPDTITCTVASGLADDYGRATTSDIVWSFDTTGSAVEETTWGQIKAL